MPEPSYLRTTRAAYDTVAVDYAELVSTALAAKPLDRALLARSPNSCRPPVSGRSPISVAVPAV